jgi:hypothetical protein
LLAEADQLTTKANQDLANQNLAGYAADIKAQQALIAEASQLAAGHPSTPPASATTSTTTTTTPKTKSAATTTSVARA